MPIKGILGPIAIAEDVRTAIFLRLVVTEVMELAIVSDIENLGLVFQRSLFATTGLAMFTTLGQGTKWTNFVKVSLDISLCLFLERGLASDFMS